MKVNIEEETVNGTPVDLSRMLIAPDWYNRASGGPLPQPRSMTAFPSDGETYNVIVNKKTHRIRFQDETESGVVIAIEPKE